MVRLGRDLRMVRFGGRSVWFQRSCLAGMVRQLNMNAIKITVNI